jgi:hypothetical protein
MAMKAKAQDRPKERLVPDESSVGTVAAPADKPEADEDLAAAV